MTRTAVVICPGRGTYNKEELGYLARHHPDKTRLFQGFDAIRRETGQETVTDLDGATRFSAAKHTRGDVASGLIYAAALADALSTAFFVMGLEPTRQFCEQRADVAALLVCPTRRAGSIALHAIGLEDRDWRRLAE